MIIKSKRFHQILNIVCDCELESPFLISNASFKQRNDVFDSVLFANDVVKIC